MEKLMQNDSIKEFSYKLGEVKRQRRTPSVIMVFAVVKSNVYEKTDFVKIKTIERCCIILFSQHML